MAAIKRKRAIQQFPSTEGSERGRHDLSELTTRPVSYYNSLSIPRWLSPIIFGGQHSRESSGLLESVRTNATADILELECPRWRPLGNYPEARVGEENSTNGLEKALHRCCIPSTDDGSMVRVRARQIALQ